MKKEEFLDQIGNRVMEGEEKKALDAIKKAIESGVNPREIIRFLTDKTLKTVGDKFESGEIFLIDLERAGRAMSAVSDKLSIEFSEEAEREIRATVVIGTVKGDMHDIGKNLVAAILESTGFKVIDLGKRVDPSTFLDKARETDADVIAMSSLMTTSIPYVEDVIKLCEERGERKKYFVLVGGGPVTPEKAREMGADGYCRYAIRATEVCKKFLEEDLNPPLDKPIIEK